MTQRSLADWLSYLEQLHPTAIDMGLERSREVARRLGLEGRRNAWSRYRDQRQGLTCALLAELLREQGCRSGSTARRTCCATTSGCGSTGIEAGDAQLCDAFSAVEAARGEIS